MEMTRRDALGTAALAGVGLPLLAACGSGTPAESPGSAGTTPDTATTGSAPSNAIPKTSVPVGGGVIANGVVVTQPTAGTFHAFSATCTHQGCQVAKVEDGAIKCPCHFSEFSIKDGSNIKGPSGQPAGSVAPLAAVAFKVEGSNIVPSA